MYTFLLYSRFTVMKYKVLLCLLWELTTPVPVERRLANNFVNSFGLVIFIVLQHTHTDC